MAERCGEHCWNFDCDKGCDYEKGHPAETKTVLDHSCKDDMSTPDQGDEIVEICPQCGAEFPQGTAHTCA